MANTDSGCFYSTEIASLLESPIWGNYTSSFLQIPHPTYKQVLSVFWVWHFTVSAAKTFIQRFPWNQCKHFFSNSLACILYPLFNLFSTQQSKCTAFQMEIICSQYLIGASLVAQMVRNLPEIQEAGFSLWIGRIPWRRERLPTPVFLPGEFHGQRSQAVYCPWSHKESDTIKWLTLYCQLEENPSSFHDWCKHNIVATLGPVTNTGWLLTKSFPFYSWTHTFPCLLSGRCLSCKQ